MSVSSDIVDKNAKTGISHRNLKPTLGIIDPLNTHTLPASITASCGLDVLCHSLESLTAVPYYCREPPLSTNPSSTINPLHRPAYQGANPISDIFSLTALKICVEYLPRATLHPDDTEARERMALAATLAGVGFGNAGVHLCHGMSYPISGLNVASYKHPGYAHLPHCIIPHGVSVAVTAPEVFKFTAPSSPQRHLQAAEIFGMDISRVKSEDAGAVLSDAIKEFLQNLSQPKGLSGLGFTAGDIARLVDDTIPQRRVLLLAPGLAGQGKVQIEDQEEARVREELTGLFERAMEW